VRALLDTSLLIARDAELMPDEGAISAASLAELHFGVHASRDERERERRLTLLGLCEAEFDPIPVDAAVARAWGALAAAAVARGLRPRRRAMDLLIAATAKVHALPLLTLDADMEPLAPDVDVRMLRAG